MKKAVAGARDKILSANKEISKKFGEMPETEKILTERQYEDQMAFVLKH